MKILMVVWTYFVELGEAVWKTYGKGETLDCSALASEEEKDDRGKTSTQGYGINHQTHS